MLLNLANPPPLTFGFIRLAKLLGIFKFANSPSKKLTTELVRSVLASVYILDTFLKNVK